MRHIVAGLVMALAMLTTAFTPRVPGVVESSFAAADGSRTMQLSVEIDAPAERVWKLFTDPATIKAGGLADAWITLGNGGSLEEALVPGAQPGDPRNIKHHIITYLPGRLMVLQNLNTPPGLPGREAYKKIVQIVEVTELPGGRSRLTLSGTGYLLPGGLRALPSTDPRYASDMEFRALWDFFRTHNMEFLADARTQAEAKKP